MTIRHASSTAWLLRVFVAFVVAIAATSCAPPEVWPVPGMMRLPPEIPKPSSQTQLDRDDIVVRGANVSLYAVAERLENALIRAGYSDFAYFQTSSRQPGFALVTQMERIDDDGKPRAGSERFLPPDEEEGFDLGRYLSSLLIEPRGYYRVIFFIVTSDDIEVSATPMTGAMARQYMESGELRLPRIFRQFWFTDAYDVEVFVYEFLQKGDKEVVIVPPVRLPVQTHLGRSGIEMGLADSGPADH